MLPSFTPPARTVFTPRQYVKTFVASGDVALAIVIEGACDDICGACGAAPWRYALVTRGLDPAHKATARIVLAASDTDADKIDAPALAMTTSGGIAAFRTKGVLSYVWLDPAGKPIGDAIELDRGDVGAPAVGTAGGAAVLVWAKRNTKTEPYALHTARMLFRQALGPVSTIPTKGSAFAPAVLAQDDGVAVAWMEGDSGTRGEIHLARDWSSKTFPSSDIVISGAETNARDPEISGTVAEPLVVWQSFTKERPAGVLRVARTFCEGLREGSWLHMDRSP